MKRINELDLSPRPWKYDNGFEVECADGGYIVGYDCEFMRAADARLCAAAPELYECLHYCIGFIGDFAEPLGADCETIDMINRAKAALAKASGEEIK